MVTFVNSTIMYISIVHEVILPVLCVLGICIVSSGMIYLWLILVAAKIEDKQHDDKWRRIHLVADDPEDAKTEHVEFLWKKKILS